MLVSYYVPTFVNESNCPSSPYLSSLLTGLNGSRYFAAITLMATDDETTKLPIRFMSMLQKVRDWIKETIMIIKSKRERGITRES